jgi:hypothetical protein
VRPGAVDHRERHPQRSRCAKSSRCLHTTPLTGPKSPG